VNASAFKWKYDDQQFSILHPFSVAGTFPAGIQTSYPFNANGELHGVELDVQARVFTRDRAAFNALYTKGKLDSVPTIINSANQVTAALVDADRPNLPTWTFNGSYEHRVALSNGGTFGMRLEAHHESSAWMRLVADVNKRPGDFRNAFTKLNLSLSYEPADAKWSIGAYCNNVTNEAVPGVGSSGQVANMTFFKSPGNPADARGATLDPPRTYGLRISASF
jgi:iron complex outermembrane receptor protein